MNPAHIPPALMVSRREPVVAWRLFTSGDRVRVSGQDYEIIHVSQARAWIIGVEDGEQQLVDVSAMTLHHPTGVAPGVAH